MKKGMLILLCLFIETAVHAQSNQVKLYLQQIAANKILIEYIRKGYRIARTGLTTIGSIRNGEFNLHQDFFSSLKNVNPNIKKCAAVMDIIATQASTLKYFKSTWKRVQESKQFTNRESDYIYSVFTKLIDNSRIGLEEMLVILSANEYQMSDDERIKRIEQFNNDLQNNAAFVRHFGNDAMLLAKGRMKQKQEVGVSHLLHGTTLNR